MPQTQEIKTVLKNLPDSPGIYKMIDADGRIIYIGKAKNLKKRVRQYFQKNYQHSTRTKKLLEKLENIEVISVDSELEAMILELNLIKQFKPKYNVIMKDDKNFVYIKITKEDFPRIQIVRNLKKDGAKYFGPKSAAHKVKTTFKVMKKIFPFRHCNLNIEHQGNENVKVTNKVIKYPCLDYFIKRCSAPCIGKVTPEEYQSAIQNVENFLQGKADETLKGLQSKMMQYAEKKEFEKAAKTRDKIEKIKSILEKQKVADPNQQNQDIINYQVFANKAYFNLFQIRDGKLIGQENFIFTAPEVEDGGHDQEILEAYLKQYYKLTSDIPKEILIPHTIEHKEEITDLIKQESGGSVKIRIPQKGKKSKLLEMSLKNAKIFADRNKTSWQQESQDTVDATKELAKVLKLKTVPKRIECYDISHLDGTDTVGSMIVFHNGAPNKSMYRKFKIRTVQGKADDYKCMEEVLIRRFSKLSNKIATQEYKFKKATKKHVPFIEEHNKVNVEKSGKTFYILEKDKEPIGFISYKNYTEDLAELANLWIKKDHRGKKLGYKLLKEVTKKISAKRIYLLCQSKLKEYYQLAGFEEIKKIPKELEKRRAQCIQRYGESICLSFNKIKNKEDKSFSSIPDLVVIDGGKGQLNVAHKVFKKLNLKIPHISLAKRLEEIFVPGHKQSIILPTNHPALRLLQRSRDEAHRFAITYNKNLRSKKFKRPQK